MNSGAHAPFGTADDGRDFPAAQSLKVAKLHNLPAAGRQAVESLQQLLKLTPWVPKKLFVPGKYRL